MRHRHPRLGVALMDQLQLPLEKLQQYWPGDAAGHHQGQSPGLDCQGVVATSARIEVLQRSGLARLTGPVSLDQAQQLALDALRVGLAGNEDTVEDTITCALAFFRYVRHHRVETMNEVDEHLVEAFIQRAVQRAGVYRDPAPSTVRNRPYSPDEPRTSVDWRLNALLRPALACGSEFHSVAPGFAPRFGPSPAGWEWRETLEPQRAVGDQRGLGTRNSRSWNAWPTSDAAGRRLSRSVSPPSPSQQPLLTSRLPPQATRASRPSGRRWQERTDTPAPPRAR